MFRLAPGEVVTRWVGDGVAERRRMMLAVQALAGIKGGASKSGSALLK